MGAEPGYMLTTWKGLDAVACRLEKELKTVRLVGIREGSSRRSAWTVAGEEIGYSMEANGITSKHWYVRKDLISG
jgi:hypothetical protein